MISYFLCSEFWKVLKLTFALLLREKIVWEDFECDYVCTIVPKICGRKAFWELLCVLLLCIWPTGKVLAYSGACEIFIQLCQVLGLRVCTSISSEELSLCWALVLFICTMFIYCKLWMSKPTVCTVTSFGQCSSANMASTKLTLWVLKRFWECPPKVKVW